MKKTKLNLGCGSVRPDGWINADSSFNAQLQKTRVGKFLTKYMKKVQYDDSKVVYINLNKRWPYKNDTIDIVYASHLFEHLSLDSAELFLSESFRCLRPGGIIRIVVPDLYKIAKKYIDTYENSEEEDPTVFIMWALNMHREGQYGKNLTLWKKVFFELQGYPHQHKFMYDEKSLKSRLSDTGFVDMKAMSYGTSEYINEIKDVEGTSESYLSVYLEAIKPT